MTNLAISRLCNLSCQVCFAKDYFQANGGSHATHFVSEDMFAELLDLLQRSEMNEVRLVGGEPTLHPRFPQLVEQVRARGLHLLVFTHGLLKEAILACLENLSEQDCTVMVNTNATEALGYEEKNRQRMVLKRLGKRASPGLTICSPNFDLEPMISLVLETGCRRAIRLGLAQPTLSGGNRFLHPWQYPLVGSRIAGYAEIAASHDIRLEFDCGFVRCMFSTEEMAILEQTRAKYGWHCSPIPDIDIDSTAFPCFPLASKFSVLLAPQCRTTDVRNQLMEQMRPYRMAGIYASCSRCEHKANDQCSGGCLAATIRRLRPASLCPSLSSSMQEAWRERTR
ncbi:MAG: radical SAM protein [Anaerolineales bacterium]|jgi:MoaA/NifB/PqqE/SkfB family radical SAM enzyme